MDGSDHKSIQTALLQDALSASADFLTLYLPLANAHAVDFIVQDAWNSVLPEHIQNELLTLSEEQLLDLPSGIISPNHTNLEQANEEAISCSLGGAERHSADIPLCANGTAAKTRDDQCYDSHRSISGKKSSYETFKKWTESKEESFKNVAWKHGSLAEFLAVVKEHCVDELLSLNESMVGLCSWLRDGDRQGMKRALPFVHAFMKEKKMHEVEVMADLCAEVFDRVSADVVIDVGSGKGYLSAHLTLQHHLPVIGIDSQSHNTSGAVQRAAKLEKQWDSLVKHEQKKVEKGNILLQEVAQQLKENCSLSENRSSDTTEGQSIFCNDKNQVCDDRCVLTHHEHGLEQAKSHQSKITEPRSKSHQKAGILIDNQNNSSEPAHSSDESGPNMTTALAQKMGEYQNDTEHQTSQPKAASKHVAVTMFVSPDTRLTELVEDSAGRLCPHKRAEDARLLLTGLHTCGPLAASMLRLFVRDEAVRGVCGVGCCYQLMQERFLPEESIGMEGDFPLSSVLLDRKMSIGRTALNVASLALPRMAQSAGQLQGRTYYPRALAQAFIHSRLGHVPQDLRKLRKLARHAADPVDYVRRALHKWNISGCEATEEELREFHAQRCHMERKMAAFFQLRATLAPVVETVVLLDRLVYLLEQDCVENAFLVRLFDPVTSPRCHAIVASKKEQRSL